MQINIDFRHCRREVIIQSHQTIIIGYIITLGIVLSGVYRPQLNQRNNNNRNAHNEPRARRQK